MNPRRILFWLVVLLHNPITAQLITGQLQGAAYFRVRLFETRGASHRVVDSVVTDGVGRFAFTERRFPLGFYELVVNDSDRVDLILDPREGRVDLVFSGLPLQQHIRVVRSDENKRLWEYKLVSKEAQAILASVAARKRTLEANDARALLSLDSVAGRAIELRQTHLSALVAGHPDSYFTKVIRADRGIEDAAHSNAQAVLDAFDFSDPSLMRCSVYDKAVLTFLRNLRATAEEQFISAADSLMSYAGTHPDCKAYMMDHLVDVFSTYGPEMALQHMIDEYVVAAGGEAAVDPHLREKVRELLKASVGAIAPDVELPGPDGPGPLRAVLEQNELTVLFFYSSTCDHCHEQMPGLIALDSTYRKRGLGVIGIALDPDSAEFRRTIYERGLTWQCHSDFSGWGSPVAKAFQVRATPFFFLLDRRMRIVAKPIDSIALAAEVAARMP